MRLTKQTNYAIRMMMYCDSNTGLSRVSSIAKFYGLSELFLQKILKHLTKAGLVESVRGRNGGIRLAKEPKLITVGEVVRITEESFSLAECFEEGESNCPLVSSCGLNQALTQALQAFFDVLDTYTIADLTNNQRNLHVLLRLDPSKDISIKA